MFKKKNKIHFRFRSCVRFSEFSIIPLPIFLCLKKAIHHSSRYYCKLLLVEIGIDSYFVAEVSFLENIRKEYVLSCKINEIDNLTYEYDQMQ